MLVKFWGVHGSLPRPGVKTLKFGGNTPCTEIRCGDTLIIVDAGSGIRELGEDLLHRLKDSPEKLRSIEAHIFTSHLHWDHVQGFPFFAPFFNGKNRFDLYGVRDLHSNLKRTIENQMAEPNFPLKLDDLAASLTFHDLVPGDRFDIDEVSVLVGELNHPGGSLGFRFEYRGKTLVYASDHEHGGEMDQKLVDLARDGDLMIYDAMFAPDQYLGLLDGVSRRSWGHSTWEEGIKTAIAAGVKHLVLFHHGNDDRVVEETETEARKKFPQTTAAYEGLEIRL